MNPQKQYIELLKRTIRLANRFLAKKEVKPKLPVPFLAITQAYGIENWSLYPTTGRHWGLDLRASEGTPVTAPLDGEVIESKYTESLGYYIQFFDGTHYHIIPHLKGLARLDTYKQGEKLAEIGKTGKIKGVHCHLEVWKEKMVNRIEQLRTRGTQITIDPAVYYNLK